MARVRIKLCGLTRADDVEMACEAGVDALGFVAVPRSKRFVDVPSMAALARHVPPMITRVALFQNATAGAVREVIAQVPIEVLQFHGEEDAAFCEGFGRPYWKAVPCGGVAPQALTAHIERAFAAHPNASAMLIDGHAPGALGGSGEPVAWPALRAALAAAAVRRPWVLAGGLTPENVAVAIRDSGAAAIDVSSGVELAPGQKDREPLRRLVEAVHCASDFTV